MENSKLVKKNIGAMNQEHLDRMVRELEGDEWRIVDIIGLGQQEILLLLNPVLKIESAPLEISVREGISQKATPPESEISPEVPKKNGTRKR